MYQKYTIQRDIVFALLLEENKKTKFNVYLYQLIFWNRDGKNVFDFGELENHFYCRKQSSELNGSHEKRQALIKAEEVKINIIKTLILVYSFLGINSKFKNIW